MPKNVSEFLITNSPTAMPYPPRVCATVKASVSDYSHPPSVSPSNSRTLQVQNRENQSGLVEVAKGLAEVQSTGKLSQVRSGRKMSCV
jgi:hypothetical protein